MIRGKRIIAVLLVIAMTLTTPGVNTFALSLSNLLRLYSDAKTTSKEEVSIEKRYYEQMKKEQIYLLSDNDTEFNSMDEKLNSNDTTSEDDANSFDGKNKDNGNEANINNNDAENNTKTEDDNKNNDIEEGPSVNSTTDEGFIEPKQATRSEADDEDTDNTKHEDKKEPEEDKINSANITNDDETIINESTKSEVDKNDVHTEINKEATGEESITTVSEIENKNEDKLKGNEATISELDLATTSELGFATTSELNFATTSELNPATTSELNLATISELNLATTSELNLATTSELDTATISEFSIATISKLDVATISEPSGNTVTLKGNDETVSPVEIVGISLAREANIKEYYVGEVLNPIGLAISLQKSDGTSETVVYRDSTKADFSFSPAITQKFTKANNYTEITITYKEYEDFKISQTVAVLAAPGTNDYTITYKLGDGAYWISKPAYTGFSSFMLKFMPMVTIVGMAKDWLDDTVNPDKPCPVEKPGYKLVSWKIDGVDYKQFTPPSSPKSFTLEAVWEVNDAEINWVLGEGGQWVGEPWPNIYHPGVDFDLPPKEKVKRDGYEFLGWRVNDSNELVTSIFNYYKGTVTVTAVWKSLSYEISFSLSESQFESLGFNRNMILINAPATQYIQVGSNGKVSKASIDVSKASIAAEIEGWYYGDKKWDFDTDIPNASMTLAAKWVKRKYTISFDASGGTVSPNSIEKTYGVNVKDIPVAEKNESLFDGWYDEKGNKWDGSGDIFSFDTNTFKLEAHWISARYRINYDAKGGTVNPSYFEKVYGKNYEGTLAVPTKAGWEFAGWYVDEQYGIKFTNSTDIFERNRTAPYYVYAKWTDGKMDVTFASEIGKVPDPQRILKGGWIEEPTLEEVEGYNFIGWYFEDKKWNFELDSVQEDMTLTAKWVKINFDVRFINEKGEEPPIQSVPYNEKVKKPELNIVKGYELEGWTADGVTIWNFDKDLVKQAIDLVALWKPVKYTIKYDAKGGVVSKTSFEKTYDTPYDGTLENPTKNGYNFDGWYIDDNTFKNKYDKSIDLYETGKSDYYIYAKYNPITYQITWNKNGGNWIKGEPTDNYTTGEGISKLPGNDDIAKEGFLISGWKINGSGEPLTSLSKEQYGHIELVAEWQPKEKEILWDLSYQNTEWLRSYTPPKMFYYNRDTYLPTLDKLLIDWTGLKFWVDKGYYVPKLKWKIDGLDGYYDAGTIIPSDASTKVTSSKYLNIHAVLFFPIEFRVCYDTNNPLYTFQVEFPLYQEPYGYAPKGDLYWYVKDADILGEISINQNIKAAIPDGYYHKYSEFRRFIQRYTWLSDAKEYRRTVHFDYVQSPGSGDQVSLFSTGKTYVDFNNQSQYNVYEFGLGDSLAKTYLNIQLEKKVLYKTTVSREPNHKLYNVGEKLDMKNLQICESYTGGNPYEDIYIDYTEETKDKFTFVPSIDNELSASDNKVDVYFKNNYISSFDIEVKTPVLQGVKWSHGPQRSIVVWEGDKLNNGWFEKLELECEYKDVYDHVSTDIITFESAYVLSTQNPDASSNEPTKVRTPDGLYTMKPNFNKTLSIYDKTVEVTYNGFKIELPLVVKKIEPEEIINISSMPKSSYIAGENIDLTNLKLAIRNNRNETVEVSYVGNEKYFYLADGQSEKLKLGDTMLKIYYYDKNNERLSFDIPISVEDKHVVNLDVSLLNYEFVEGDRFAVDNLITRITINYNTGAPEELRYYGNQNKFEFDPPLGTVLTTDHKTAKVYYTADKSGYGEFPITVSALNVTGINVTGFNTQYRVGEKINARNASYRIEYKQQNGVTKEKTIYFDALTFTPSVEHPLTVDDKTVKIEYKNVSKTININVENISVDSITVINNGQGFYVGQEFNMQDIGLRIRYSDRTDAYIMYSAFPESFKNISPAIGTKLAKTDKKITFTYEGEDYELPIDVTEPRLLRIELEHMPQTEYILYDQLNVNGLAVKGMYQDGEEKIIEYSDSTKNDFEFIYSFDFVGNKNVQITYKGCSIDTTVVVRKLKVTFETQYGNTPTTQWVEPNATIQLPKMGVVDGRIVVGWYDGDELWETDINGNSKKTVTKDLNLKAKWKTRKTEHTISSNFMNDELGITKDKITKITIQEGGEITNSVKDWEIDEDYLKGYIVNSTELIINIPDGDKLYTTGRELFSGFSSLNVIENIDLLDTSNVVDFTSMFEGCTNLTSLDLSSFTTQKATTMEKMFYQCTKLENIVLTSFDVKNVTNMNRMFGVTGTGSLTELDLSNFNTEKLTNTGYMFANQNKLKSIYVSVLSMNNVSESTSMFANCNSLDGGYGTIGIKDNKVDKTYALVDEYEIKGVNGYFRNINTKGKFKVTYQTTIGNAPTPVYVNKNSKITAPTEIIDEEWIFDGWYLGNDKWTFSSNVVENDITLVAHWIKKEITEIYVGKTPKLEYFVGDLFNPTGLQVLAVYNNNKIDTVNYDTSNSSDFTFTGDNKDLSKNAFDSAKDIPVKITYKGKALDDAFTVKVSTVEITKVEIPTDGMPTKTSYFVGETFNPNGLKVSVTYNNKTTPEIATYNETTKTDFEFGTVDMSTTGTKTVTVKYKGKAASSNISITVNAIEITKVEIPSDGMPTKTSYFVGDTFDPSGLKVSVTYNNKTTPETVTYSDSNKTDFEFGTVDMSTAGAKTVTVKYKGVTANSSVSITVNAIEITKVEIPSGGMPTKTSYFVGDTFDPSGLKVSVTYNNKTTPETVTYSDANKSDFVFGSVDMSTAGTKTVTVTYKGKAASNNISLTVNAIEITKVEIPTDGMPTKTSYFVGDTFSPSGLKVSVTYNNKTTPETVTYSDSNKSDFVFGSVDMSTAGTKTVTVMYKGKAAINNISLTVKAIEITKVEIPSDGMPTKTSYFAGDTFNPIGLKVSVTYNNKTTPETVTYSDANKADFEFGTVDMSTAGAKTVTVKYKGTTANSSISITVKAIEITKVEIPTDGMPTKTSYFVGETFNPSGLKLSVTYNNKTTPETVEYSDSNKADFEFGAVDMSTAGAKTVTVKYKGTTANSSISITLSTIEITKVEITSDGMPTKTSYFAGDTFDPSGLKVSVTYNNNTTPETVEYNDSSKIYFEFGSLDMSTAGTKTVTVKYKGKTANSNISITVKAIEITKVEIPTDGMPTKTSYFVGDTFNPSGLKVSVTYNNKTTPETVTYSETNKADFEFGSVDMSTTGTKTVTVKYKDKAASNNISLTINAIEITKVEIPSGGMPTKTSYFVGDAFDPSGLKVSVTYNNKTTPEIATYNETTKTDFEFGTVDMSTTGTKTVTVKYKGKAASNNISLTVNAIEITKVEIPTDGMPTKTSYFVGDTFSPSGLKVSVTYNNKTTPETITYSDANKADFEFGTVDMSTAGAKTVTVKYKNKAASNNISLTVNAIEITKVEIPTDGMPTKTSYFVSETFNPSGLKVSVTYNNKTTPETVTYSDSNKSDFVFGSVDMSTTGTKTVTVTYKGKAASNNISITVKAIEVTKVEIPSGGMPTKTSYFAGDTFDPSGLKVSVTYNNKTTPETVTYSDSNKLDFEFGTVDMSTAGAKTVTVKYKGVTANSSVSITVKAIEITKVEIPSGGMPTKTSYFVGDTFNPSGLKVSVTYNNKTTPETVTYSDSNKSDFVFGTVDMSTTGTKTVTVKYKGTTANSNISITVNAIEITKVEIPSGGMPTKTSYFVGDTFDPSGLKVSVTYNNKTTPETITYSDANKSDFVLGSVDMSTTGTKTVTVIYKGKAASNNISITVKAIEITKVEIPSGGMPTKTSYFVGETFNPSGLKISVTYNNKTTPETVTYSDSNKADFVLGTVDMSTAGTKTVTVTYKGKAASNNISLTVKAIEITKVEIPSGGMPTKTSYFVGETFNPSGLKVSVTYNNKTTPETVTYSDSNKSDFVFGSVDMSTAGTKAVTVKYKGKAASSNISITVKAIEVTKVEIPSGGMPTKTSYFVGDAFNPSGLKVSVTYNNKTTPETVTYSDANKSDFAFGSVDMSTAGTKTVTVKYKGKAASSNISITVNAIEITNVEIPSGGMPTKTSYFVGETFNPSGLKISVTYNNKTTPETVTYSAANKSDFVFGTVDMSTAGTKTVTVKYKDKTASNNISLTVIVIDSVAFNLNNAKTDYEVGDTFDPNGIEVILSSTTGETSTLSYNDDTKNGFTFEPSINTKLSLDDEEIIVTYAKSSASIAIDVKKIVDMQIVSIPTVTNYKEGQNLNIQGLIVECTYVDRNGVQSKKKNNGTENRFKFTPSLADLLVVNHREVVIEYEDLDKTISYSIRVTTNQRTGSSVNNSSGSGGSSYTNNLANASNLANNPSNKITKQGQQEINKTPYGIFAAMSSEPIKEFTLTFENGLMQVRTNENTEINGFANASGNQDTTKTKAATSLKGFNKILVDGKEEMYYLDSDSNIYCGLVKDENNNIHYFGSDGKMLKNATIDVGGVHYNINDIGEIVLSDIPNENKNKIYKLCGKTQYTGETVYDPNTNRFLTFIINPITNEKELATGLITLIQDDGMNTYFFDSFGTLQTGICMVNGKVMEFSPINGKMIKKY